MAPRARQWLVWLFLINSFIYHFWRHWVFHCVRVFSSRGFSCGSAGKESACNAGDLGSIPGWGRSPGEGKGYPVQHSGLENPMDCVVHGVAHGWVPFTFCFSTRSPWWPPQQGIISCVTCHTGLADPLRMEPSQTRDQSCVGNGQPADHRGTPWLTWFLSGNKRYVYNLDSVESKTVLGTFQKHFKE